MWWGCIWVGWICFALWTYYLDINLAPDCMKLHTPTTLHNSHKDVTEYTQQSMTDWAGPERERRALCENQQRDRDREGSLCGVGLESCISWANDAYCSLPSTNTYSLSHTRLFPIKSLSAFSFFFFDVQLRRQADPKEPSVFTQHAMR